MTAFDGLLEAFEGGIIACLAFLTNESVGAVVVFDWLGETRR